ncbi:Uncharacterised protein [Vibrio cholerae]|nr:Uncharacterised protein [Vibrio cholerae]
MSSSYSCWVVNWQKGIHCQLIIFISLNMKSIHFL